MEYIDCFDFVVFNVDRVVSRTESHLFTHNLVTCVTEGLWIHVQLVCEQQIAPLLSYCLIMVIF